MAEMPDFAPPTKAALAQSQELSFKLIELSRDYPPQVMLHALCSTLAAALAGYANSEEHLLDGIDHAARNIRERACNVFVATKDHPMREMIRKSREAKQR